MYACMYTVSVCMCVCMPVCVCEWVGECVRVDIPEHPIWCVALVSLKQGELTLTFI